MAGDGEPTRVGRYEVPEELGRGGMATVHLARQLDLDRLVALKRLDGFADESDRRVRRFVREERLAASLSHPNVVTVHDAFDVDGVPYIAMEYVPGGTLRELLTGLSLEQIAGCSTACSPAWCTRSAARSCTATSSPRT
jgi:serine/threonine protein kinase